MKRIRFIGPEAARRYVLKREPKAALVKHGHREYSIRTPEKSFPVKCGHCGQTKMVESDGVPVGSRMPDETIAWLDACVRLMTKEGRRAEISLRSGAGWGVEEKRRAPRRTRGRKAASRRGGFSIICVT